MEGRGRDFDSGVNFTPRFGHRTSLGLHGMEYIWKSLRL